MSITADDLIAKSQIYVNSISNRVEPEDWYEFFSISLRDLRKGRTMPEQRRVATMDFYSGVFKYNLPSDFDSMIKPNASMASSADEGPYLLYGRDKDFYANNKYGLAITNEDGQQYLMARYDGTSTVSIDGFSDDAAAYTLSGDATGAFIDLANYYEGIGSLGFNIINGSGVAKVKKSIDTTDITAQINMQGRVFFRVYMPVVVTSATINLYSSATDYYTFPATSTDFLGNAFTVGWNFVSFSMKDIVAIGTPDQTAINAFEIILNHGGVTANGYNLDSLFLGIRSQLEFPYNSKYLVKDSLGAYKEKITEGTDVIQCNDTFESVIMYNSVWHAATWKYNDEDTAGKAASEFKRAMIEFNRRYPSTEAPLQSNYFRNYKF